MARIRSVKPEFWDDRKLAQAVSRDARLLYIGLWNFADEHSRCNGDPVWLAGHIFPYESDIGADEVARYLDELARCSRLVRYDVDGDPFLFLPKLADHQRLEPHKVASKYPDPPETAGQEPATGTAQVFSDEVARDADSSGTNDASLCCMEHVAGSMEHVGAASAAHTEDPTSRLLIEHVNAYPEPLTPSQYAPVRTAIAQQVGEGVDPDRIRAGLARMRERNLSARMLPELVVQATAPPPTRSTTDERIASTLALRDKFAAREGIDPRGITA